MQKMWAAAAFLAIGGCNGLATDKAPSQAEIVERGRYLVRIMDCSGCHSPRPGEGSLSGGGLGFNVSGLGVFWPPNLTPHPTAGLGRWSEKDIVTALRTGKRPDGRELAPAMPWPAYAGLTDDDARAVAAFLKSLPASDNKVPAPTQAEQATAPYFTVKVPQAAPKE